MDLRQLSPTEVRMLCLFADGMSDEEVARACCRSVHTVRSHRDRLLAKTGCRNRVELTRWAIAAGHVSSSWSRPAHTELGRMPD